MSHRSASLGLVLLPWCALAPRAFATDLFVPGDWPTIQAAIDHAVDDDWINVYPGTYVENVDFRGKRLNLVGAQATIDGDAKAPAITLDGAGCSGSLISGFALRNGRGALVGGRRCGGGIRIGDIHGAQFVDVTILDTSIRDSSADDGGGLWLAGPSVARLYGVDVQACTATNGAGLYFAAGSVPSANELFVHDNVTTVGGSGGGIWCAGRADLDEDALIERNGAPGGTGGGLYVTGDGAVLRHLQIDDNWAFHGGGAQVHAGSPSFEGCDFRRNSVAMAPINGEGGGIGITGGSRPTISNCLFEANAASVGGGGYSYDSAPSFTGCVFRGNSATVLLGYGGGLALGKGGGDVGWCEFSGNTALYGGGIALRGACAALVFECRVGDGRANLGGGIYAKGAVVAAVSDCWIERNGAAIGGGACLVDGTRMQLASSWLLGNVADGPRAEGGGLYASDSDLSIDGCELGENQALGAASLGGGLSIVKCGGVVDGDVLHDNVANRGGGIAVRGLATPWFLRNEVHANRAEHGGGLYATGKCTIQLENDQYHGNFAATAGGGAAIVDGATATILSSLFDHNESEGRGGALYFRDAFATVLASTIADNASLDFGDGIMVERGRNATVKATIVWGDVSDGFPPIYGGTYDYCDVAGVDLGGTNFSLDPRFLQPAVRDYRVATGSPCIDAGGALSPGGVDLGGDPRVAGRAIDVGAYEQ